MTYCIFPTPFGWMGLVSGDTGLKRVLLPENSPEEIEAQIAQCGRTSGHMSFGDLQRRICHYLSGGTVSFRDVALDMGRSTEFQKAVWRETLTIPCGRTRSYRGVAENVGRPHAYRAVGQAMVANPVPLVVPCHRVIASSGKPGGYGGGVDMKRRLLQLEGIKL